MGMKMNNHAKRGRGRLRRGAGGDGGGEGGGGGGGGRGGGAGAISSDACVVPRALGTRSSGRGGHSRSRDGAGGEAVCRGVPGLHAGNVDALTGTNNVAGARTALS